MLRQIQFGLMYVSRCSIDGLSSTSRINVRNHQAKRNKNEHNHRNLFQLSPRQHVYVTSLFTISSLLCGQSLHFVTDGTLQRDPPISSRPFLLQCALYYEYRRFADIAAQSPVTYFYLRRGNNKVEEKARFLFFAQKTNKIGFSL